MPKSDASRRSPLEGLNRATRVWFKEAFGKPTLAQQRAWPAILRNESTLLVAPTGSGKTLAAFLCAIDRLLFCDEPNKRERCRVLYVSPLKALAFDIERNLRLPLAGIEQTAARLQIGHRAVEMAMRTGDTQNKDRARFVRAPSDILITTPESLYLMLTSRAREALRAIDTVIVDEIHAIAGTKRGSHLFVSLERLEALRSGDRPLTRIGLSATQRPLEEIARLLGGMQELPNGGLVARSVVIADARESRPIEVSIELPSEPKDPSSPAARAGDAQNSGQPGSRSIWDSIYPRLVELVRAHRSTMIFVNNRRLAERLCAAINDTAGEPLARAHHGSVAREQRGQIEEALKSGKLPCIVATSSLELGLDIGTVDQVVQIESPPSVASGIQRIGRANHHVGGSPRGLIFPKHRGDLVACTEAARRMRAGQIEPTRYPRNALDVLAQQVVAIVASQESIRVDDVYALVRRSTPYAELSREQLESVLDMLSGRYPSDEFAELRPRLTWSRDRGTLKARKGAKHLAVANAGVIPDRGLYGVFVADASDRRGGRRVGELDEEMVFEARVGDVFVLGASSWLIEEITHDRVLVSPAPGRAGTMPFWHGDGLGRSAELGRGIGELMRTLARLDHDHALHRLSNAFGLNPYAAQTLIQYLREQEKAPYALPTDRRIVIERFIDEVGDFRICILSPFGVRVHTPLALCIEHKAHHELGIAAESVWSDDGIVLRFPDRAEPPDVYSLFPSPEQVEDLLAQALGGTPLFASHFRECASRALLLPRRSMRKRTPLWAQRRRAKGLLQVAARFGSFPIILETFRECLQDVFDLPALVSLMKEVASGAIAVTAVDADRPSPFAATLLFGYIGHFMYEGDTPLSERRAAALSIDPIQLRELLGQVDLKDLLSPEAIDAVEARASRMNLPPRDPDELHDLLLWVGDLSLGELDQRLGPTRDTLLDPLLRDRRVVRVRIAAEWRVIAAEDSARYRDAIGVALPPALPAALLEPVPSPLMDLVSRYARTHGPFSAGEVRERYGLSEEEIASALDQWVSRGRLMRGELHPRKAGVTYCDVEIMRAIKRRSLAELRKQVEPVDTLTYARFLLELHGIGRPYPGLDGLSRALERLEGAPLDLSVLESEILPARVPDFVPSDLDQLLASGAMVWRGIEPHAIGSGRVALYFRESFDALAPPATPVSDPLADSVRDTLRTRGAMFFHDLVQAVARFAHDVLSALWALVWAGEVTNDTLQPLRSLAQGGEPDRHRGVRISRILPGSEGRWSLLRYQPVSETARRAALVQKLLTRHGVLMREALKVEGVAGGFSAVYEVLKTMEDTGKARRGYFVEGLGAAQFVEPGVEERLRARRAIAEGADTYLLASTDPASPWGASLPWPPQTGPRPMRSVGSYVILAQDGRLVAWLSRREDTLITFLSDQVSRRARDAICVAQTLARLVERGDRRAILIAQIDGDSPARSSLSEALLTAGFRSTSQGYLKRAT